jgi:hypothetical protein
MDLCECDDGVILVTDQVPSVTAFAPTGRGSGEDARLRMAHTASLSVEQAKIYLAEIDPSFVTKLTPC